MTPGSIGVLHTAYSGITMGDIDNDDDLDMVLVDSPSATSQTTSGHVYRNLGNGTLAFLRTFRSVDGFSAGLADLDHDGDLDLVFAGDRTVFLNDGVGGFTSGPAVPVGGIGDPRSIAFADIDDDGDLDLAIGAKQSWSWIVRNDRLAGNWLKVRLVSPAGQAGAFGAKVRIFPAGGLGGRPLALREARSSDGYLSQSDPVLHFGLGSRDLVDVEVTFVGGTRRAVTRAAANQTLLVDGTLVPPPAPPGPPSPPPPPPCTYSLGRARQLVLSQGGCITVGITTQSGCGWSAASGTDWIAIDGATQGVGSGRVELRVARNDARTGRTASASIAGLPFVVAQEPLRPAALDLNADGLGDVFRYDPSSGAWAQEIGLPGGGFATRSGVWSPGWTLLAGSLDAEAPTDLLLYDPTTGDWFTALGDGEGGFTRGDEFDFVGGTWSAGWAIRVAELDGANGDDLLLYDPTRGDWFQGLSDGVGGFDFARGRWSAGWSVEVVDFDLDGRGDVLVYDPVAGVWAQGLTTGPGAFTFVDGRWPAALTVLSRRSSLP